MKTVTTAVLAAVLTTGFIGLARANVNTFSGVPTTITPLTSYTENGVTVTTASGNMWSWPTAGQLHFDVGGGSGDTATFTFSSGVFTLASVDISYAEAGAVATFSAFSATNSLLFSRVVNASTLGTVSFTGWTGISRVVLVDSGSHFSIDNLVLTAVPEPASSAFLLAGLALTSFVVKRRK